MMSFLKPKLAPAEPFDFRGEVVIERSAGEVYALLDWADPENAQRRLGNEIVAVEGVPDRFRMTLSALPGHVFDLCVTEAAPHAAYAFTTSVSPVIGRMATSHERYVLEPLGVDSCRLELVNRVHFVKGMRMKHLSDELLTMTVACHNALAKLKIQAEKGVDAVNARDGDLIVSPERGPRFNGLNAAGNST